MFLLKWLAAAVVFAATAAQAQDHWYRCNTHTHTSEFENSDSNGPLPFVANWYRTHGYDCLVITDHEHLTDVVTENTRMAADGGKPFLLIRGQEITQAGPGGGMHVNGLNIDRVIYPLGYPQGATRGTNAEIYARNFAEVAKAGGLPQLNHPGLTNLRAPDLKDIQQLFLFEVWNAFPSLPNLERTLADGSKLPSSETLWDQLLTQGNRFWAVASDDVHEYYLFDQPEQPLPGRAWIVVRAPSLTTDNVMNAVRAGNFYTSTGVEISEHAADAKGLALKIRTPRFWKSDRPSNYVYKTVFTGRGGKVLAEVPGLEAAYAFKGDEGYVRATVIDSSGRRAWTQPVFLTKRP